MKRSILMSLLVIGAAATLIGAASLALFSDSETSKGNTFQAGTVDLQVNGKDDPDVPKLVSLGPMLPSEWAEVNNISLRNMGNRDAHADIHFGNVSDADGLTPEAEPPASPNDLQNHVDVDICNDLNNNGQCDPGEPKVVLGKLGAIKSHCYELGPLPANGTGAIKLVLSFHLQDVGNDYQGDITTFDINFTLHQANAPHPGGGGWGAEIPCPAIP